MLTESIPQESSRHKCLIYEGHPSEQLPVVIPLLRTGLQERRRCLYLGDPEMVDLVSHSLSEKGVKVEEEVRRGALLLSSDRSHLQGGRFDPPGMIRMLVDLIDGAVSDGYSGLCATGDMMWELGTEENFEQLLVYESLLEMVFREKPLTGICQYRRGAVPARAIRDALTTHRSVYIGRELRADNLFYLPPELLLEERTREVRDRQGEWMCDQITRVLRAEDKRDRALDALRRSEAEQRRLAEELAGANEDLERRVRERTEELEAFTYSVSHDLRAPLRAMDGFSKILMEEKSSTLDPETKHCLSRVVESTRRMQQLVQNLLQLSRMSRAELRLGAVDMQSLVRDVVSELVPAPSSGKLEIQVGTLPRCLGDQSLLRQVLLNLIGNAVKYSSRKASPRVEIGGSVTAGEVLYWVKDNGAGFDGKQAAKLFRVFQRLHSESEFEGTGVGLSLVKRIVERHEGRVWAEGSLNQGATFFFALKQS